MAVKKKAEPRQRIIGTCGHKIQRILKAPHSLLWYCPEGHEYNTGFARIQLEPRGKAK